LDRDAVLAVFDCRFVADAANVVFVGGVGTGKTHLYGNYVATFACASPGITGLGRHASWQSCIDHCP
jgi:chromosomal replication initiation ATPase DnaA